MNIPVAVRLVLLALALLTLFSALRSLRAARRAAPGHRTRPWLDVADHGLGTVLLTAFALPGEHWDVAVGALFLLAPVMVWQGVLDVRSRREAKAGTGPAAG
uniref:Uncharacterized protein n=1 Tax=Streptomyces sp. NBC_00049 TaxID=2903617 RepID=A0AAU2JNY5_9ACTN